MLNYNYKLWYRIFRYIFRCCFLNDIFVKRRFFLWTRFSIVASLRLILFWSWKLSVTFLQEKQYCKLFSILWNFERQRRWRIFWIVEYRIKVDWQSKSEWKHRTFLFHCMTVHDRSTGGPRLVQFQFVRFPV